jgi:predicted NBD/HSP70 family sugar kinase
MEKIQMIQIGVDFGGTKIEVAALGPDGDFLARIRAPTHDGGHTNTSAVSPKEKSWQ